MINALLRAKRIAFFHSVAASSEFTQQRSTRKIKLRDPWLGIRHEQRDAYLRGEGRLGEMLRNELTAEFPESGKVWRASVWEFLDPELPDRSCEYRLYEVCDLARSAVSVDAVLEHFLRSRPSSIPPGLDEISLTVLALRVARRSGAPAVAMKVAALLAKLLLTLSGCAYRCAAAEELWKYCGHLLLRGLRDQVRAVVFDHRTWNFVSDHAMAVTAQFKLLAYASPLGTVLPFQVVEELMRDLVMAVVTDDEDQATSISARLNLVSAKHSASKRLPDIERLSIWQPLAR